MVEEKQPRVRSLNGFLKWAARFRDAPYLFRGVSDRAYEIEASAYRRLSPKVEKTPAQLLKINRDLINKARLLGHDWQNGQPLSDLDLLAQLQHYGAATCLIDFTRNAMVALWMACQPSTENEDADGKIFAVCTENVPQLEYVTPEMLMGTNHKIESFFEEKEKGYQLFQWQPKYQNNRIIAQQSVFIFGAADIPVESQCIIPATGKVNLLKYLERISGIAEESLFPDFDGFARQHAWNKPYITPDAQDKLQLGRDALQRERRDGGVPSIDEAPSPKSPSPEASSPETVSRLDPFGDGE